MRLGVRAALVDGELVDGDVTIEQGVVSAVGVSPRGAAGLAVPGFVDVHVNGFAGVDFMHADADGLARAAAAMASTGVVAFQPTLVSAPEEDYAAPIAAVAEYRAVDDARPGGAGHDAGAGAESAGNTGATSLPEAVGIHLEGPFLSPIWPGAHDPAHLRPPDRELAARLRALGPVTTVTIAPELPGALELIEWLVDGGVVVSCGHADADARAARAAFDRGASAITHVHNAHRRWKPRDPGLGGVALVRPGITVQAIVDGVHLAPESAYAAFLAAGERFCLVTDAIEATQLDPGAYTLAGRELVVADGAARLADGTLSGSVVTMDQSVRNLVEYGAPLAAAVHAASTAPAALLGRADLGVLAPGAPASIAVLDDALRVTRTLVRGAEAFG